MATSPLTPTARDILAYLNQWSWVRRIGRIDANGAACPVHETPTVMAARTGNTGALMLATGATPDRDGLQRGIDWLRHHQTDNVLVWSATPDSGADAWLLAHGAQESFRPCWMARPGDLPLPTAPSGPATVGPVARGDLPQLLNATDLPYYSTWQARSTVQLATAADPDAVVLMIARIGGEIVGRGIMHIVDSPAGRTAGIYDVGILPQWQRQGIGRQLMHGLLAIARQRSVDLVTLNATPAGEPLYHALGFTPVGEGQTWLLTRTILRHPPASEHTRFALRIAEGDPIDDMARLSHHLLPNGETPLAMAARFGQVDMAETLLDMGTVPDIAALWSLDLHDEAERLMAEQPAAIDARHGDRQVAPIHVAIYWDDLDFLETLLHHGADPTVRDGAFNSDAWGWCHAVSNEDALAVLDAHIERASSPVIGATRTGFQ